MEKLTIILAITLLGITSCKKGDDSGSGNDNSIRISQYIMSTTNTPPRTTTFSYDAQGRNTEWTYGSLEVIRQASSGSSTWEFQCLLNTQGLVSEVYTRGPDENYRRKITYDAQKRITQITVEQQYVNNGIPNSNMRPNDTFDFTWDGQSNVISAKHTRFNHAGAVDYYIYTYSGFSAEYPNTLKPVNIGLDFFGPYGYPSLLTEGGGNGGFLYGPCFMGRQLPAHVSSQRYDINNNPEGAAYSYSYTLESDSKGRIGMVSYDGVTYRFDYQ